MVPWLGLAAMVAVAVFLWIGWSRGWSMVQTLTIAMAGVWLLGVLTATRGDLSLAGSPLLDQLGWRPSYGSVRAWMHWPTIVSTMFLHADAAHIVSNLVVFMLMGLGFEERIGRGRFLVVFMLGGIIGTILHSAYAFFAGGIHVPVVGASGAVFAVIAAYATMWPRDKVVLFFILILPNVPVYIAAVAYTFMELFALLVFSTVDNVARYAHIGGLLGGVLLAQSISRWSHPEDVSHKHTSKIDVAKLRGHAKTPEHERTLDMLEENRDEPELAKAWLERFAASVACDRCGKSMHAVGDTVRCSCGRRLDRAG